MNRSSRTAPLRGSCGTIDPGPSQHWVQTRRQPGVRFQTEAVVAGRTSDAVCKTGPEQLQQTARICGAPLANIRQLTGQQLVRRH